MLQYRNTMLQSCNVSMLQCFEVETFEMLQYDNTMLQSFNFSMLQCCIVETSQYNGATMQQADFRTIP